MSLWQHFDTKNPTTQKWELVGVSGGGGSTGESQVVFSKLADFPAIGEYVAPKVAMQQAYELQIKACETVDEVNEIVIDYDE